MKLIIDSCDNENDPYLVIYNPLSAAPALAVADHMGWNQERRWASEYVPIGEVWYTQEVGLNRMFDYHLDESSFTVEDILDELLP